MVANNLKYNNSCKCLLQDHMHQHLLSKLTLLGERVSTSWGNLPWWSCQWRPSWYPAGGWGRDKQGPPWRRGSTPLVALVLKERGREGGRESKGRGREGRREEGKERGRKGGEREGGREGGRKGEREERREGGREGKKERGRELVNMCLTTKSNSMGRATWDLLPRDQKNGQWPSKNKDNYTLVHHFWNVIASWLQIQILIFDRPRERERERERVYKGQLHHCIPSTATVSRRG